MDRSILFGATTYTLFGLASVFTIGRVLSRWPRLAGRRYAWDDWIDFLTYACVTGLTVAIYYQLENGLGRYQTTPDPQAVERFLICAYVSQHLYVSAIFGTKLSLVLLYARTWPGRSTFWTACMIVAIALICAFISFEVLTIVRCLPISHNWRVLSGATATCIDQLASAYSLAGVNIAFNIILLLFPVPKLSRLDASLLQKTGICAVYFVGFAVTALSAVRVAYLDRTITETNVTWHYSYAELYGSIEVYLSQVCCCMPALVTTFNQNIDSTSRPSGSDSNRKSASTARSHDRESGAVIGIKGIGPSVSGPEKLGFDDEEEYERAPSPTIGLQSRRAWEETIFSISQPPTSLSSNRFGQPSLNCMHLETPSDPSTEDLRDMDIEDRLLRVQGPDSAAIGIPSIVGKRDRLSADLLPFAREPKLSASRLNLHSW